MTDISSYTAPNSTLYPEYVSINKHEKVRVFNEWVYRDVWDNADKPSFLYFTLTEWVHESSMTDQEKIDNNTTLTQMCLKKLAVLMLARLHVTERPLLLRVLNMS